MTTRRIVLIGIGPGDPEQLTLQAVRAMNEVDFFVITEKHRPDGDPLAAARTGMLARHRDGTPEVVVVDDPERDRTPTGTADASAYRHAVTDWHAARAAAYIAVLSERDGRAGFLVWGDPALYDSIIRILTRVAADLDAELQVVPGISSLSALAARHRIVLHGIGEPLHITTGRRLAEAVAHGHPNIAVLLNRSLAELAAIDPTGWRIWWGANLGTPGEHLVHGPLATALADIETARREVKDAAGWVLDVYLLQRDEG